VHSRKNPESHEKVVDKKIKHSFHRHTSNRSRPSTVVNRWDEKAGLRRDAVRSQVIDALEAQKIKETGNEEG
jgi:hypothetical protein